MVKSRRLSVHQKWLMIFLLWAVLLTGGLSGLVGSPGILQAVRLKNLLEFKQEHLKAMHQDLEKARKELLELENSRSAQIREIRKVLGYAAPDELIFDFNSQD